MDKEEVVHVQNGILTMENNVPLLFEAAQMSLEILRNHEISRKAKTRSINRRMDKEEGVDVQNGILVMKKNKRMT